MPRECQRRITLLLRGLRSSGTPQLQKRPKPGLPAYIVERGTHHELLQAVGLYGTLYERFARAG